MGLPYIYIRVIYLWMGGKSMENKYYAEKELFNPVSLCDSNGELNADAIGWSRHPLHKCNLKGRWLRKKKWNYWCIISDKYLFSITMSNVDYAGLAFAYFYNFTTKEFIEKTIMVPFGIGCYMPDNVRENIVFKNKNINLSFIEEKNMTKIHVDIPSFGNREMCADISIIHPEKHETMNAVIPWNKKTFQYTSKQNCLPSYGIVTIGDEKCLFEEKKTYAVLDFGRGIWPRSTFWNWATCSADVDGKTIGFNLGGIWTEGTGMTENAFLYDNRIVKLSEDVQFDYDKSNLMKKWDIKTKVSDRINIIFEPEYERIAVSSMLFVKSDVHQMIGRFSGEIKTDDGIVKIEKAPGCAEEHTALW